MVVRRVKGRERPVRRSQKAVSNVIAIIKGSKVSSRHSTFIVQAYGFCAPSTRIRHCKNRERPVRCPQKAMSYGIRVRKIPHDHSRRIDSPKVGTAAGTGARCKDAFKSAIRRPQKAFKNERCVVLIVADD